MAIVPIGLLVIYVALAFLYGFVSTIVVTIVRTNLSVTMGAILISARVHTAQG